MQSSLLQIQLTDNLSKRHRGVGRVAIIEKSVNDRKQHIVKNKAGTMFERIVRAVQIQNRESSLAALTKNAQPALRYNRYTHMAATRSFI